MSEQKLPFVVPHAVHRRRPTVCPPPAKAYSEARPNLLLMRRGRGFTLLELMTAIAVVGIVLAVGIPSFRTFIASNRLASQTNELLTALSLARSEAMKRGVAVTVCQSANQTSCQTSGSEWRVGWIVFAETAGGVGTVNTGEPIIASRPALPGNNSISFNGNPAWRVTYNVQGMTTSLGTLSVCDSVRMGYKREIRIARTGRAEMHRLEGNGTGCA